jgi:hypothetical protein
VCGNIYRIFKVSELRKIAGCGRRILITNLYGLLGMYFLMNEVA